MVVHAIVYDLDGTLIDSAHIVAQILNRMREDRGLPALLLERYTPWMSVGGAEMIGYALDETDSNAIQEDLRVFRQSYLNLPTPEESVYPGVRETLMALTDEGYHLGVCTNKPRVLVDKIMAETGLGGFFRFTQAGGDLAVRKPHPDTLKSCILGLGSSYFNTLMVGDSTIDQKLAMECKTDFVFFSDGYDDGVDRSKSQKIICEHLELIDWLADM